MRLVSWLDRFAWRLSSSVIRARRPRRQKIFSSGFTVEQLEYRRLLSAGPIGFESRVNTFTPNAQIDPSAATDANGNYIVVWASSGQDGSGYGIYAQRYDAGGNPLSGEFRVNTFTAGAQGSPSVAMSSTGDFVVTWDSANEDGNGYGVYAHRYNAAGAAQGGEFKVNTTTTGDQGDPRIAISASGAFVITWNDAGKDGNGFGVYAQRYNSSGVAQGSEFKVNTYTTGDQAFPDVAMDSSGDFVITWQSYDQDGDKLGVYAQRYTSAGSVAGGEFKVNTYTTSDQRLPSVAMDSTGNFVIAWQSFGQDGDQDGIYAKRFNNAGAVQGSEFKVNTYTTSNQGSAAVGMDQNGNFVIDWQSAGQDGFAYGIYGQVFTSAGAADGPEFRVNTYTTSIQRNAAVAMDSTGDFVTAWKSYGQDGSNYGIYSQRFFASAGPFVSGVLLGAGPQDVQDGDKLISPVSSFTVDFSTNMNAVVGGANSVRNTANWRLFRNGVDVSNLISGITFAFNAAMNRYAAVVTPSQTLTEGSYQLVARQTIQDLANHALDGEPDKVAGGDYHLNFTVATTLSSGPETKVNTYTTGAQSFSDVGGNAAGDYVIAWTSVNQTANSGYDVYAQRYHQGIAQGSEFKVNTYTTGDQKNPSVAMDAAGNFVITWSSPQDGNGQGVYAQRFNSAGVAQGTEFRVNANTTADQTLPRVAMDAAGNFVVTFQDGTAALDYNIYAQRFNAAGVAQLTEFKVNTHTANDQTNPAIGMDASGDFVIAWNSYAQDGSNGGVFAQRFAPDGTHLGNEFLVNIYTTAAQGLPSVAMDHDGDFVLSWQSNQDGSAYGIYARRYDDAGNAVGTEFKVNTYTTNVQSFSRTSMDANGDFVVTWRSYSQDGGSYGVYAQRYNSGGVALGSEFRVNTYTTGPQTAPSVVMDGIGDFVVVWNSSGQDGSGYGVYSQRYVADVAPVLSNVEGTTLNAVGALFTPVTATLLASDPENSNWTGATVQITSNYLNGQDVLGFTNQLGITGNFNAATGTLTLTGSASVANYQAALRAVTYHNSSGSPNMAVTRTLEFQANDGMLKSSIVSRSLIVVPNNVLSGLGQTVNYNENGANLSFAQSLVANDPQAGNVTKAVITVTNWQAEDRLSFSNVFGLQHTENIAANVDTYTITGSDTVDHYQTLLRSFQYWDISDNPNTAVNRVASIQLFFGAATSNSVTQTITVTSVNDAPKLSSIEATPLVCQTNNAASAIPISGTLLVTDADSTNLTKAVITIQNHLSGDKLSFTSQNGITGSFDSVNGILTLTGTSGVGNYRTAIRSVTFSTTGGTGTRTLSITATDDFSPTPATSLATTRTVNVTNTNIPPAISGIPASALAYVRGAAAVAVAPGLFVLDSDGINLSGATVQITSGYQNGQDILAFTAGFGVTGSFNAANWTLTLSGITSLANYQTLLRSVTYKTNTAGASTTTRTISFTINDGLALSSPVTRNVTLS